MKVTAALVIFAGLLATAVAFSCYQCNTYEDKDCQDDYTSPSDHLVNCTELFRDDGACYKQKFEIHISGTMYTIVQRGCQRISGGNNTCNYEDKYIIEKSAPYESQGWSCNCYADSCNGGVEVTATSLLLAVAVGTLAIY